jgi:arginine utilization protein RocB
LKFELATRARELALMMTRWASVTGTSDEARFPERLAAQLDFDTVWLSPLPGDLAGRKNIFALKRGTSRLTIVLTGHFDVVSADDYGPLRQLAFEPELLRAASIKRLRETGENPLALADFESGEYLPGRGLLDMKAGLAAGLAAMEAYRGHANLVFIGVADEEEKSAGARAAVRQLKQLAADENLDIALVINLDAIADNGDGSRAKVVAYGSIGKQLLTALVVGKQTHAGYPQNGVNAAYVMSELVQEMELSPDLSETTGSEIAAPPTVLYAKDLKQGYNVTTPHRAFAYWNSMQHRRSGAEVLDIAMALAARAVARAEKRTGQVIALKRVADFPSSQQLIYNATISLPEQSLDAMIEITSLLDAPTVIMGFGSIPYPAVLMRDAKLWEIIRDAVQPHGLGEVNYFAGISDMSFFGESTGDLSVVAANTPIWGTAFDMPEPANFPTINIGPWGRDYHTWLERLHAPYAFEVLPCVLLSVIDAVAKKS